MSGRPRNAQTETHFLFSQEALETSEGMSIKEIAGNIGEQLTPMRDASSFGGRVLKCLYCSFSHFEEIAALSCTRVLS